jgi:predicted nucleic acid-binding protein
MRVLFDTNVVLDVLLEREPYAAAAAQLLSLVDDGHLEGFMCATTVTTVHYLASKAGTSKRALSLVETLLDVLQVAPVDREVVVGALELGFADFEDAVVHEAAAMAGATAIVTRNGRDFRGATIAVFDPNEMLAALRASGELDPHGDVAETYPIEMAPSRPMGEMRGFLAGVDSDFRREPDRF